MNRIIPKRRSISLLSRAKSTNEGTPAPTVRALWKDRYGTKEIFSNQSENGESDDQFSRHASAPASSSLSIDERNNFHLDSADQPASDQVTADLQPLKNSSVRFPSIGEICFVQPVTFRCTRPSRLQRRKFHRPGTRLGREVSRQYWSILRHLLHEPRRSSSLATANIPRRSVTRVSWPIGPFHRRWNYLLTLSLRRLRTFRIRHCRSTSR